MPYFSLVSLRNKPTYRTIQRSNKKRCDALLWKSLKRIFLDYILTVLQPFPPSNIPFVQKNIRILFTLQKYNFAFSLAKKQVKSHNHKVILLYISLTLALFPPKTSFRTVLPSVALGQLPHHYYELPHNGLITDWGWCHHVTLPSLQWRCLFSNWATNKKQGTFLQKYRTFLQKYRTFLQKCRTFFQKYRTFQMKCGLFFAHYGIFHQKCKTFCWTNPTIFLPKRFQRLQKTPFRCFFLIFSWKSCHKIWSIDENTINLPRKVCRIDY